MWRTPATAALVEENDSVNLGIPEAPRGRIAAAAGTAVKKHRRFAAGITALFVIKFVGRCLHRGSHCCLVQVADTGGDVELTDSCREL